MSELVRQHRSRDLWVSRSHLWAAAASVGIALFLSFLVGNAVGRSSALRQAEQVSAGREDDLVELLARVEASASAVGGADRLTYPDALAGRQVEVGVPGAPELPGHVDVPPPPLVSLPGVGAPPQTGFGIQVLRTAELSVARTRLDILVATGLPVWVRTIRSGGVDVIEVGAGPWESEAEGRVAVSEHVALLPLDSEWIEFE